MIHHSRGIIKTKGCNRVGPNTLGSDGVEELRVVVPHLKVADRAPLLPVLVLIFQQLD